MRRDLRRQRRLDIALVLSGGLLGTLLGFFSMVVAGAHAGLSITAIAILAALGGLAGGLCSWVLYLQLLAGRSYRLRATVLVLLLILLAIALPQPFRYVLIRN